MENEYEIPWPQKGDKLFTAADDWKNNACLNYLPEKWYAYARGYKLAADIIVEHVTRTQSKRDVLVYPTVFLYRQYLELIMKEIIKKGGMLLESPKKTPITHDLNELWKECRDTISKVWPEEKVEDFEAVEAAIAEFSKFDPSSMTFRYPANKKGKELLAKSIKIINLRNLSDVMNRISSFLDAASSGITEEFDNAFG